MIALLKRFPQAIHAQRNREYRKFIGGELAGRTAGILGLGNIGLRVARICQALDMRILGMRRSVTESLEGPGPTDLLLPPRDLPLMLQQSDFLIICLPGTRETLGLLGDRELQQMKRGSYLINVGRGGIVDEEKPWYVPSGPATWQGLPWMSSHKSPCHQRAPFGTSRVCC